MSSRDRLSRLTSGFLRSSRTNVHDRHDAQPLMFEWRTPSEAGGKLQALHTRSKLLISYAPDWISVIVITGCFHLLDKVHGFWREFSLGDTSIQYPFAVTERVPNWALGVIALGAPLLLLPLINVVTVRSLWDWHNSWLGLILGLSMTAALTQTVKVTVGRPRPDLISRCQPRLAPPSGLVTAAICTQTDIGKLKDGFRSFWSGHASLSFAGLGFLSWYLAGKMHLFDRKGHTLRSFIFISPLTGAMLVAISRTMDYRHHWQDVLVGSIVGLLLSFFAYHQYYPSLTSANSHLPFSPRIYPQESQGHNNTPSTTRLSYLDHIPNLERGRDYDPESQVPGAVPREGEPVPLGEIGE